MSLFIILTMIMSMAVLPNAASAENYGDFIVPLDEPMPEAGVDGFIVPLDEPMPRAGADGFIAPITAPDPNAVVITTAEELASIKEGSYVLGNDIYLQNYNGGVWTPLEPEGDVTLDGQGHKIYNLNIPESTETNMPGL